MAKSILVCFRSAANTGQLESRLRILLDRLTPDNVRLPVPRIQCNDSRLCLAILNPNASTTRHGASVCLGKLEEGWDAWWRVASDSPEGTFALFRANDRHVELITDVVGSRTIWYAHTDDLFVAATSQRAISFFLGDYRPSLQAFGWMLSAGTIGPGQSWDNRIRPMPPDARLRLDRRGWSISVDQPEIEFAARQMSDTEHERRLRDAIERTMAGLAFDNSHWVFPLSGGVDCRTILSLLGDRRDLACITWGVRSSLNQRGNDAFLARRVAAHFGLEHRYFEADGLQTPFETLLDRFLVAGEGRVDHLTGYQDGFATWTELVDSGIDGVIRGDQGFCPNVVSTEVDTRHAIHLAMLDDYPELQTVASSLRERLGEQRLPDNLRRRTGETLDAWRDRLRHSHGLPAIQGALNDLKASFVEIANPLLARRIIDVVRGLPDHLRRRKLVLRRIAEKVGPDIPFARHLATDDMKDLLRRPDATELLMNELNSQQARDLFSNALIDHLLRRIASPAAQSQSRRRRTFSTAKRFLPKTLKRVVRNAVGRKPLDPHVLALRACLVCRMTKMLREDAQAGRASLKRAVDEVCQ